jgi:Protein of unknown function (DUF3108)
MILCKRSHQGPLSAVAAALALIFGGGAMAQDADNLSLSYAIYVSGSRVYKINYTASLSSDHYKTSVSMGPKGLGKLFSDYKLDMTSSGVVADGRPRPTNFASDSEKDDEKKRVKVTWSSDDLPKADRSFGVPPERTADVEAMLEPQTPDPLTAVLHHALKSDQKPCTGTLRAYNGAEIYELAFKYLGRDEIGASHESAFSGHAFKCEVVFVPVAGYSEKKKRKLLKQPPAYTVWFAAILSPTTSTKLLVPVRAIGNAGKRRFEIVASDAKISGRPLAALSRLGN